MNGFAPPPFGQPPSVWQEHRTPDGRAYYYNTATKATQWTKPEEMMSPAERALANQPWKEYTAEGGRKYWYNTETKESSWDMPEVYKTALGVNGTPSAPTPQSSYAASGPSNSFDQGRESRDSHVEPRQITYPSDPKAQSFVPASNDPEYSTAEEAEAAFNKLLRRSGVQPDWTWEQAIRATARDPQFRAIKDPRERKAAFEKFCQDVLVQDKERAKERLTKLRADFETMLKRHPEIKHYTRWKTARPILEGETTFRSTKSETERRQLFEEYIIDLKKAHAEEQTNNRRSAIDGLADLLPKLELEPYTRWADAQNIISTTQPFQNDAKYKTLTQLDVLTAFQNHMKAVERGFAASRQEGKDRKYREERKARDAFKALLAELRKEGKINAGTKWSQFLPLVEKDERYINMAGNPGSTAQELFWDIVEEEGRALRGPRNLVLDVLEDKRYDLTSTSEFEEFLSLVKDDRRTANIDRNTLKLIFDRLREKRVTKREDKRDDDRNQRRAIDDLRSHMRRVEPPITINDSYEDVRARLLKSDEFQAVTSEESRRAAFDKHIRRLREKEEDAERRERRRDRPSMERDRRDRDRSRGERSHRSSGRRRSRSPEVDAYEADRRRAIAERERNHRKSTMAENLLTSDRGRLSPPPRRERERERDRDRDRERDRGRDRDFDRPPRSRRDDDAHYDRERRVREEDRERLYRRRTERGGSYDELPYGDERSSGTRRRREDEDDSGRRDSRDSKRIRREKSLERTPLRDAPRKKTPQPEPTSRDIRSGSEEGEIEEEE
ncbi:Pre-mRNA-processing protein prp40 [Emericellopsis cladophorae]|uniref:Pre-mRNA-processing protein prp40 n=1 Tax=Emericellopsis cladophorae TaxID=2686198 RepID=A0A9P9Y9I4_9HYPO|nr:Pre-mRNA-processing protein prp40 [Emericellopsis cladophorae]KAI6785573.1 Pre-mRNA-processing protein prp40 [Emericellopsis cladophorae]